MFHIVLLSALKKYSKRYTKFDLFLGLAFFCWVSLLDVLQ